jgi:FKBP-type peptidyl-prolyl cis-trans isomerase
MTSRTSAESHDIQSAKNRKRFTWGLLLSAAVLATALASGCGAKPAAESTQPAQPAAEAPPVEAASPAPESPGTTADVTELKIEDVKVGTGAEAKKGTKATVNYTGWLTDGTKFDSSLDSGQPFTFTVDGGEVIKGWDEGVEGMKVGGIRKLTIPADLGYGAQGAGGVIPPNATLVFEVELLAVN